MLSGWDMVYDDVFLFGGGVVGVVWFGCDVVLGVGWVCGGL